MGVGGGGVGWGGVGGGGGGGGRGVKSRCICVDEKKGYKIDFLC